MCPVCVPAPPGVFLPVTGTGRKTEKVGLRSPCVMRPVSPRLLPVTDGLATAAALSARTLGSRTKLRPMHKHLFDDERHPHLLAEVGRAVCTAEVLPRKELYEAWEVATRIDAAFPTATRIADLAAGHGLLAWLLLLLAREGGRRRTAVCVDLRMPVSAETLGDAITRRFPDVASDFHYVEGGIEAIEPSPSVLLTAIHACGPLSDDVLHAALGSGAAVALLPCCHSLRKQLNMALFREHFLTFLLDHVPRTITTAADHCSMSAVVRTMVRVVAAGTRFEAWVLTKGGLVCIATCRPVRTVGSHHPVVHAHHVGRYANP